MSDTDYDPVGCAELIERIKASFSGLSIPGRENIITNLYWAGRMDMERRGTIIGLNGKAWQSVDRNDIVGHASALPTLTPEAFRYYLPAFLIDIVHETIATLKGQNYPHDVSYMVIPMIIPWSDGKEDHRMTERMTHFTTQQSQAVYDFLIFRIPISLEEDDLTPDEANRALVFWKQKIKLN
ncbi:MAG: hypothetical protein H7145_00665 [Akkermansiaceae bacterium]|nr:hypothetical protein [Armatimonadota bacterium]